ncbi:MAG: hypothetical protein L0H41_14900 [Microlunatus sp.]|nr:hypothetical protein [Microlunatus sp.]MDN5771942.1 hypothetical protein [Microlunatus sp.]
MRASTGRLAAILYGWCRSIVTVIPAAATRTVAAGHDGHPARFGLVSWVLGAAY